MIMTSLFRFFIFALFCGFAVLTAGCGRSELFGRLSEGDANAVMVVLYGSGIDATKVQIGEENWRIEVAARDHQRALMIAREHGVPRERFASLGELFKKDGLISTPSEVRMRYTYALSQELSSTLSQIDGVVTARVHPVIPANDPLSDKVLASSAAVFIKHLPDADLKQMAPAIRTLVARSVEGLTVENVSLTFFVSKTSLQLVDLGSESFFSGSTFMVFVGFFSSCLLLTFGFFGWKIWRSRGSENFFSAEVSPVPDVKDVWPSNRNSVG